MTAGRQSITENKDWGTPPKYVDAVQEFFNGVIHLDPCSNDYSIVNAVVEYSLPEHDGLQESWNLPTIYVNPPYGADHERGTRITHWLRKCEEAAHLYGSEVLALVPVATNTGHWKKYVFGKATGICFLYDTRLRFLVGGQDGGKGAPMSCAMIYWGSRYERFFEIFNRFGAVVDIRPLKALADSFRRFGEHGDVRVRPNRVDQESGISKRGRPTHSAIMQAAEAQPQHAEHAHKPRARGKGQLDLLSD